MSTECIIWTKAINNIGYGVSWKNGKTIGAHREAYEKVHGSIPKGMVVRHDCDNKACVNPDHLRLGTYADNSADMVKRNRQAKGEKVGNSVLTNDLVLIIRSLSGSAKEVASLLGCSKTTVKDVRSGKLWSHV